MFGLYDYILGIAFWSKSKRSYIEFDSLIEKSEPELKISPHLNKCWTLTVDITSVIAMAGGYSSASHYEFESDVNPRIHLISKPFFFLSALDDPFGPDVVPIDHCHDKILIGVTKSGGHCSWV